MEKDFKDKMIEELQDQIKRLNFEKKDTIKMQIDFNGSTYEVDTQIKPKYKIGDILYYNDKDQTRFKIGGFYIQMGILNHLQIAYECIEIDKEFDVLRKDMLLIYEKNMFKTKDEAYTSYLKEKWGRENEFN